MLPVSTKTEQSTKRIEKCEKLCCRRDAGRRELEYGHGVWQGEDSRRLANHRHGVTGPEPEPDQMPDRRPNTGERKGNVTTRQEPMLLKGRAKCRRQAPGPAAAPDP